MCRALEEGLTIIAVEINVNTPGVGDLWDVDDPFATYVLAALKAKHYFIADKDYVVKDKKVFETFHAQHVR